MSKDDLFEAFNRQGSRLVFLLLFRCATIAAVWIAIFCVSEGGKGVNDRTEITGDHGSSFVVNLLCDLVDEVLGGLRQQLCGS